jgi:hypothetical protein
MAKKLCEATHPNPNGLDYQCEREHGHKGKHDCSNGPMWTDKGALRAREELKKQIAAEPF